MTTKVASYLTALGFRQIATIAEATNYNKDTGGEFIIILENNCIYRYDGSNTTETDGTSCLATSDGGNTRWILIGGTGEDFSHGVILRDWSDE